MSIQAFVEAINDENVPDWRNFPINHLVLGLFGERGEVANLTKKHSRHVLGWVGADYNLEEYQVRLKEEIADNVIYSCLICGKYGWDLFQLVKDKVEILKEKFGWK